VRFSRPGGSDEPTDRLGAADAGFDCHLVKPVNVQELVILLDARVAGGRTLSS